MTPAIVLAGGLGTRLGPMSQGLPKPMVPVAGRPFLEFVLDSLVDAGCPRIVLTVSHRWQVIADHFGSSYRDVPVEYSIEEAPLGTGGALAQAFQTSAIHRAIVANGDTLFDADLRRLLIRHDESRADVTIALREVADTARYGAVELGPDERIRSFYEKGRPGPGLVNGGIYVVDGTVFEHVAPDRLAYSFEMDILQRFTGELRLIGVRGTGYFIDIGVPEDLDRARRELEKSQQA